MYRSSLKISCRVIKLLKFHASSSCLIKISFIKYKLLKVLELGLVGGEDGGNVIIDKRMVLETHIVFALFEFQFCI